MDVCLDCLQLDTIMNKDTMNVLIHFFWWMYALIFIGLISSSEMVGSMCRHMFSFSRYYQTAIRGGCTSVYSRSATHESAFSSHAHDRLDLSVFSVIAVLVDMLRYLTLILISLMANNAEPLSIWHSHLDSLSCEMLFSIFAYLLLSYLFLIDW